MLAGSATRLRANAKLQRRNDADTVAASAIIMRTFERWELKTVFEFFEDDLPLREVKVFVCYRYKPGVLLD